MEKEKTIRELIDIIYREVDECQGRTCIPDLKLHFVSRYLHSDTHIVGKAIVLIHDYECRKHNLPGRPYLIDSEFYMWGIEDQFDEHEIRQIIGEIESKKSR